MRTIGKTIWKLTVDTELTKDNSTTKNEYFFSSKKKVIEKIKLQISVYGLNNDRVIDSSFKYIVSHSSYSDDRLMVWMAERCLIDN